MNKKITSKALAKWNTKYINNLPDAAFAIISTGGEKDEMGKTVPRTLRHLPHHNESVKSASENTTVDKSHLRNALARVNQISAPASDKSRARAHLDKHARALLPSRASKSDSPVVEFISMYKRAEEDSNDPVEYKFKGNIIQDVEIFRTGVFRGRPFVKDDLEKMVENFHTLRGEDKFRNVPVRVDHPDPFGIKPRMKDVAGYIVDLRTKNNGKVEVMKVKTNEAGEPELDADGNEKRVKTEIDDVRLVADFEMTEPEVFEKIKRTTYRDRSIEWGRFPDNDGNVYDPTLLGVAFVDIPQVDRLASLFNRYDKTNVDIVHVKLVEDKEEKFYEKIKKDIKKKESNNKKLVKEVKSKKLNKKIKKVKESSKELKEITKLKKEVKGYMKEKFEREMKDRLEIIDAFVKTKYSTPAMAELEKQLVKAFFAQEGEEDYLSSLEMFELFTAIKKSTPKVWEKKDNIKVVDKEKVIKNDSDAKSTEEQEKIREEARTTIKEAGFEAKD